MEQVNDNAEIVWHPDPELAQSSNLAAFMRRLGIEEANPDGYRKLLELADTQSERFWNEVIAYGHSFRSPVSSRIR
jgi:acetyl-CoA synthetase